MGTVLPNKSTENVNLRYVATLLLPPMLMLMSHIHALQRWQPVCLELFVPPHPALLAQARADRRVPLDQLRPARPQE